MSDLTESRVGSLWRRWDLHIHTPGTKLSDSYGGTTDANWNRYLDILEASSVQVFGITDYFCVDSFFELTKRYAERHPSSQKVFFPNAEFRLSQSISGSGSLPHIHVIFDNNAGNCSKDKIARFFSELKTQSLDGSSARPRCCDLRTEKDFMSATVSLDDLIKALDDTFGTVRPYRIAFPANNDGMRSTDNAQPRKVVLADRIDRTTDIFFGGLGNIEYFLRDDRYAEGSSEPKPVLSGSDCHSFDDLERLTGDVAGFPSTWIKADATFAGLKQICFEPESRIFIGQRPAVLTRQEQDGTKFVRTLRITQVGGYDEGNGRWFKNVEIPLNPELTAIIGNKGSGKSAIVDILGLLADSRQEAYFSFLTDDAKSKKFRQRGYAENFVGTIEWCTGRESNKLLSAPCDLSKAEAVRYLPQNYFEQLTNEIEIEQFRREIEDVVFSHVDDTERLGKASFEELEETKTLQSKQEISEFKRRLRELNVDIVRLEEQSSPAFRQQLLGQIATKTDELAALDGAKPKPIEKPDEQNSEQVSLANLVDQYSKTLGTLQSRGQSLVARVSELKVSLQEATSIKDEALRLQAGFALGKEELSRRVSRLGIEVDELISLTINTGPLDALIASVVSEISATELNNELSLDQDSDLDTLVTLPDLRAGYAFITRQIDAVKEQLSTPQRRYQEYQERLGEWETKRIAIVGEPNEPRPETLGWLVSNLRNLDENLASNLARRQEARREVVKQIFESKRKVLSFYGELKSSVEDRLSSVRAEGFEIEIDASFVVDRDFRRQFLNNINQRKRGPFRVDQDAQAWLGSQIQSVDWNDVDAVVGFCDDVCTFMQAHDSTLSISDQTINVKDFYDFLFSLDYLSSKYELQLGRKNLNQLSPGEKGLLLLIFYLQLDLNDTPLVIDQPEDNLDNDSIFAVLAKCIRAAKKTRQVILVTHNPNLAVGADAEEVVYVKLDKTDDYKFSYETGGIENAKINARLVHVLEGSQPAFVKRRLKYGIA